MTHFNTGLFQWIAAVIAAHPWTLVLMRMAAVGLSYVAGALVVWCWLRMPSERRYLGFVLLACGLTVLLSHFLAAHLAVPRPFVAGLSARYIAHGATGSMPSSHAASLMLISLLLLDRPRLKWVGVAMAGLAVATGIGRVFVGVHYAVDILAGFALALLLAAVFRLLYPAAWRSV